MFVLAALDTSSPAKWYCSLRHGAVTFGSAVCFFIGLAIYVGAIIYLANMRVTVDSITDDEIKFRRVSAAFANAIPAMSSGSSVVTPQRTGDVHPSAVKPRKPFGA